MDLNEGICSNKVQRSQLLLLVQEVHNHAEIAEFCQRPPAPP